MNRGEKHKGCCALIAGVVVATGPFQGLGSDLQHVRLRLDPGVSERQL